MITEIIIIDAQEGLGDKFAEAYPAAHEVLVATPGCLGARMRRSQETPDRFIGVIEWESKEHHLKNFGGTDRFQQFLGILGPFVAGQPRVEHFDSLATRT